MFLFFIIALFSAVYDDDITEAFVKTLEHIAIKAPHTSIYVALEKRFVFTIADCDSVAPCYDYFVECLNNTKKLDCEECALNFPKCFQYDRVKELVLWRIRLKE